MKRTPLKRTGIKRKTRLNPKGARKKRTRKAPEVADDREQAQAFHREVIDRAMSVGGLCERCYRRRPLQAHHLVPRSRAKGWTLRHCPKVNGAALCAECHGLVHDRNADDWRDWLFSLEDGMRKAYQLGLATKEGAA